ncbi:MAG: hypothetical protein LBU81_06495 [Methanosarcinales archaeon]|nr:hypothetical protein [Methanosarcinales archaeon]
MGPESPAFLGSGFKVRIDGERMRLKLNAISTQLGINKPGGQLHERFSPHCFRHWFTTTLEDAQLKGAYVDELRGDKRKGSRERYHHIQKEKIKPYYQAAMPDFEI